MNVLILAIALTGGVQQKVTVSQKADVAQKVTVAQKATQKSAVQKASPVQKGCVGASCHAPRFRPFRRIFRGRHCCS